MGCTDRCQLRYVRWMVVCINLTNHWDVLGGRVVVRAWVNTEVTGTVPGRGVPEVGDRWCIQHVPVQLMVR